MMNSEKNSDIRCLKNKKNFFFKISKQDEVITPDHETFASVGKEIKIYLNGVIYDQSEEQLIDGFSTYGSDYIDQLEGSFVIFLVTGVQLYILTDKVNSKKAYYGFIDQAWYVSNDIDSLPKDKCQISLAGLACYLASGVMLNDLTLFQEIRSAKRASVHSIKNCKMSIHRYWNYQFEYSSSSNIQPQQYQQELEELLIDSVKRRHASDSNTAISLSAGYESRGILGILYKELKAKNVSCFSYALSEDPIKDSDADLSKEIAAQCGYPHQVLRSYSGNLIEHLIDNAREGKCVSDYCIELDAWHQLAASNQFSDIFVGDECFGYYDMAELESKDKILGRLSIRGASGIKWLGNFLSNKIYLQMCQNLKKLSDDIFETANTFSDLQDKTDFLYLDQKLNHYLMAWRENFCSQAGFVHNPFLDGNILEFVKKLPPQLRKDELLFHTTIEKMLPELFSIKRATSSGFDPDWQEEVNKHKDLLISFVQATNSRLDDIISRKEVLKALEQKVSLIQKARAFLKKVLNSMRSRFRVADQFLNIFFGPREIRSVKPADLLLRLLIIRIYLSQHPSGD